VRFEVLVAVVMKSSMFWDITPLSTDGCFGGIYRLHLQGRRIEGRNQYEAGSKLSRKWTHIPPKL
jgi:hypothetical protein